MDNFVKYQLYLPYASETIFLYFFIFSVYFFFLWLGCNGNQFNSATLTKFICLIEDYSRNISVRCKIFVKISAMTYFHFSHYKSMENLSCNRDKRGLKMATKTQFFRSLNDIS